MSNLHPDIAAVLAGESDGCIVEGDCLDVMPAMPQRSVNLVFGSPPYEDRRTYGIDFALTGQAWADWMVRVVRASLRICDGLVAFVVSGKTENYEYSATPELLIADLKRAGVCLRRSPIYKRDGIPGSGGPDWWKANYEPIVCATNGGKLPWSDNTAIGKPAVCAEGGKGTYRNPDGSRNHNPHYAHPDLANPGLIIDCGSGGGGNIGDALAHKNEAPFAEALAGACILCFCPPGGTVLDPFSGSGTTCAVAKKTGRKYIGIDIRESQVEIARARLRDTERPLFTEGQ